MEKGIKTIDKRKKKPKEGTLVLKIHGVDVEIDTTKTRGVAEQIANSTHGSVIEVLGEVFNEHPDAEHGKAEKIKPGDLD